MCLKNTLKQLLRTPVKTVLFAVLIALSCALLVCGLNLWQNSSRARAEIDETYVTRGTLTQMADVTNSVRVPSSDGTVAYEDVPSFTLEIAEDAFDGLPTKIPVENRPLIYTKGIRPDEKDVLTQTHGMALNALVFTPVEDFSAEDFDKYIGELGSSLYRNNLTAVKADVISFDGKERSDQVLLVFSKYNFPEGMVLKAGTPYFCLAGASRTQRLEDGYLFLTSVSKSLEKATASNVVFGEYTDYFYEYTEDFWDTDDGRAIRTNLDNAALLQSNTFFTLPTNSLDLLASWYNKSMKLKQGREITREEFDSGAKVCMVPENLLNDSSDESAYANYLRIGDKVSLSFLGQVYGLRPIQMGEGYVESSQLINGEPISPTEGGEYEIVGTYEVGKPLTGGDYGTFTYANGDGTYSTYDTYVTSTEDVCTNMVIVPMKSLDTSAVKTVYGGPLIASNTSFILENGSLNEFMDALNRLDCAEYLQVSITDMGYSSVRKGIDAVALVSKILFFAGAVSTLFLLIFFVYLQIARSRREAAIQISLGSTKRQSAAMLLLSVLLVSVVGVCAGTLGGHLVTGEVSRQVFTRARESGYSRDYSDQLESSQDLEYTYHGEADPAGSALAGASVFLISAALSAGFAHAALKKEPLELF